MSSDPRVHKPRLPKAYTDQQLAFLKSHLPEFERRSQGSIRGDAKKFALERASDFIVRFGLPQEFHGVEESEARFKEQIYNWFKNTVGRTRRKLEGRPRTSSKKSTEKALPITNHIAQTWNTNLATPNVVPYSHSLSHSESNSPAVAQPTPIQYGSLQSNSTIQQQPQPSPQAMVAQQPNHTHPLNIPVNHNTLREGFLQGLDSSTVASMIQTHVVSNPSPTPLTPVIDALFEATLTDPSTSFNNRDPHPYLRRFLDASTYFPSSIVHAGVSGPLAGPRALQMQIRKYSMWMPSQPTTSQCSPPISASSTSSISDEMQRIASDRQRRKDHIQWARIHAAALELGILNMGRADADNTAYAYAMSRAFSEMMVRDAVWECDEVEWVAGIYVLRAVIRTAIRGDRRQRDEYDELLRTYERRWKEIKDEARQALVTEVLLSAKDDLTRLDESLA